MLQLAQSSIHRPISPGDEFFGDSPKGLTELWAASIYTYLVKHVSSSRFIKRVKDDEKLGHFARDCVSILDRPTLKKELGDQILAKMKHILNENKDMITDKQSEGMNDAPQSYPRILI